MLFVYNTNVLFMLTFPVRKTAYYEEWEILAEERIIYLIIHYYEEWKIFAKERIIYLIIHYFREFILFLKK